MDLFCFIECAKQSRSPEVLFDLLVSCSSEQGFSQSRLRGADGRGADPPARVSASRDDSELSFRVVRALC